MTDARREQIAPPPHGEATPSAAVPDGDGVQGATFDEQLPPMCDPLSPLSEDEIPEGMKP